MAVIVQCGFFKAVAHNSDLRGDVRYLFLNLYYLARILHELPELSPDFTSETRAMRGLTGRLVQIEFSLMVVATFLVNTDQPQRIGATLITHPVTHGQDNPVSGSDGAEAP